MRISSTVGTGPAYPPQGRTAWSPSLSPPARGTTISLSGSFAHFPRSLCVMAGRRQHPPDEPLFSELAHFPAPCSPSGRAPAAPSGLRPRDRQGVSPPFGECSGSFPVICFSFVFVCFLWIACPHPVRAPSVARAAAWRAFSQSSGISPTCCLFRTMTPTSPNANCGDVDIGGFALRR